MKHQKLLLTIIILLLLAGTTSVILFRNASYDAAEVSPAETVAVSQNDRVTFYDGPGTEDAVIFYPGAMVQDTAYADLLQRLASNGVDCFLVRMPLRLALLNIHAADDIMTSHSYSRWYLAGHSLGGAMACMCADQHHQELTGLILLAAYSTKDLSQTGLKVLSLTGTEDGVISRTKQDAGKALLPDDAVFVDLQGGNHAGFGVYGDQKGDGQALISGGEQREQTCAEILHFIHQQ